MKDHAEMASNGQARSSAPDLWLVLDLLVQRWHWLVLGGLVCASLFFLLGWHVVKPKFTATAQLLRYETPGAGDFFGNPMSGETFAALLRSPDLLRVIGQQAMPPIPPEQFVKYIKVDPDPDSDIVKLHLASPTPWQAIRLVNVYATNAVAFVRAWYAQRAQTVVKDYLQKEVDRMDQDIAVLDKHFRQMALSPVLTNKLAQVGGALNSLSANLSTSPAYSRVVARERERLDKTMGELDDLLLKYTEIHPLVQAKEQQIAELKSRIASVSTNHTLLSELPVLAAKAGEHTYNPELDIIRTKLLSLEEGRVQLANRQREAQLYSQTPPGIVRLFAGANLHTVESNHRRIKIGLVTIFGGVMGVGASLVLILLVEFVDNRLKTRDDVKRVAKLPVLTTLGNLHEMGAEARSQWAFRTWTMLQGQLGPSANHGLVCGITSSCSGEGRSTWIKSSGRSRQSDRVPSLDHRHAPLPPGSNLKMRKKRSLRPNSSKDLRPGPETELRSPPRSPPAS